MLANILKGDFRKAGYFYPQSAGLWSTEFSGFSQGGAQFQSSICIWNILITLFYVFILHLIVLHQHKPPNLLQLFSLLKCHQISAISLFSFSFAQVLRDVQDWTKTLKLSHPKIHILAENQRSLGCSQKHCPPHVQNHSHHPCCPWWIFPLVTQPNPVFPS